MVGVDSRGLRPESLASESESSSASTSLIPPSQVVSRPNVQRSFTPQVRTLLSCVRATACIPPVAISTTPTDFASRLGFSRGLFTSMAFLVPRPSSPALPSPKAKISSLVVGAAFRMAFGVCILLFRGTGFGTDFVALELGALSRFGGGLATSSLMRRFLVVILASVVVARSCGAISIV